MAWFYAAQWPTFAPPLTRGSSIGLVSSPRYHQLPRDAGDLYSQRHGDELPWLVRLMERRSAKIAAVALANKIARMAWAMMVRGEYYKAPLPTAA